MNKVTLLKGDCLQKLKELKDNSVDSVVTDPPYGIGFMNKEWDSPKKHRELVEREQKRSEKRYKEGKSPAKGTFSKGVQPGLAIGGAKEGKWFEEWTEQWAKEAYRVLKPGGYVLSFCAPRMYHRMASGIEDAGFQIRDQIMWVFGSGFPKSHNIGKAVDKLQGNEREVVGVEDKGKQDLQFQGYSGTVTHTKGNSPYEGWGTALKPAHEPIVMARKPFKGSVAQNVLEYGTGGINIDECRIEGKPRTTHKDGNYTGKYENATSYKVPENTFNGEAPEGRFPANIIFDEEAGKILDEQSGELTFSYAINSSRKKEYNNSSYGISGPTADSSKADYGKKGGASRFFYCPKASKKDRNDGCNELEEKTTRGALGLNKVGGNPTGNDKDGNRKSQNIHPTVKPTDLMSYLVRLVTPKGGTVLDPFMGSGSTGKASVREGMDFIGIEREDEYMEIAKTRIEHEEKKHNYRKFFDAV